jgi:hypothetical protein
MAIAGIVAVKLVGPTVIAGGAAIAYAIAGAALSAFGFTANGVAPGKSPRGAYPIHQYPP